MKIAVIGAGYVGLSLALLFAQNHEVVLVDIIKEKVEKINAKISPIKDSEISLFLKDKKLNIVATLDLDMALDKARFVVIATPTNYDDLTASFDTTQVEKVIARTLELNKDADIIIKSTIPVGFVLKMRARHNINRIIFSPEFLREGHALMDNLYPSRIIVGDTTSCAQEFANLLLEGSTDKDVKVLLMAPSEAEAVKLFANTYLAMRVAFFNELDTYAELKHLDSRSIIEGVGLDPRIGTHYNNPSFGFGGTCLPKDSKQLLKDFADVPNNLIAATTKSNDTRIAHIVKMILATKANTVGIYRLVMKKDSDNINNSIMLDLVRLLENQGVNVIIYEPLLKNSKLKVIANLAQFKKTADLIVANRLDQDLNDVIDKVYSRDLFKEN